MFLAQLAKSESDASVEHEVLSIPLSILPDVQRVDDAFQSQLRTCVVDSFLEVLNAAIIYSSVHGDQLLTEEDVRLGVLHYMRQSRYFPYLQGFVDPIEERGADKSSEWLPPTAVRAGDGWKESDDSSKEMETGSVDFSEAESESDYEVDTYYVNERTGTIDAAEDHDSAAISAAIEAIASTAEAAASSAISAVIVARAAATACKTAKPAVTARYAAVSEAVNRVALRAQAVAAALAKYSTEVAKAAKEVAAAVTAAECEADADLLILLETPAEWLDLLCCPSVTEIIHNEIDADRDRHTAFYVDLIEFLKPHMTIYFERVKSHPDTTSLREVAAL
jgi:hypothetical protein